MLRRYRVLDTPAEVSYDRVVGLVARLLDVPIALISLVDESRAWFKARVGLDATETPRDAAFCAHAILGDDPLIIPDATVDPRFRESPFVASAPDARAYAGAPLVSPSGHRLGALCAIDTRPRTFTKDQIATLVDLSRVVVDLLEAGTVMYERRVSELKRAEAALAERVKILEVVLESAAEGILFADARLCLRLVNSVGERLIGRGVSDEPLPTNPDWPRVMGVYRDDEQTLFPIDELPLRRAVHGEASDHVPMFIRNAIYPQGIHLVVSGRPVRDPDGQVLGGVVTLTDVSALRKERAVAVRAETNLRLITESLPIGLFVHAEVIRYANPMLYRMLDRLPAESLVGTSYLELIHPDDRQRLASFVSNPHADDSIEVQLVTSRSRPVWVDVSSVVLPYDGIPAVLVKCRDITARHEAEAQLRASLHEKEVLLREIHHRVKNNLAVVSSMLYLQSRSVSEPIARTQLEASQARVHSISLVHEHLYRTKDLSRLDLGTYVPALVDQLAVALAAASRGIAVHVDAEGIELGIDAAVPCGLIISELVTNAIKHGFTGRPGGVVLVTIREVDHRIELVVADDGIGFPAGFGSAAHTSLGLELISALVDQLHATLEIGRVGGGGGARVVVRFLVGR